MGGYERSPRKHPHIRFVEYADTGKTKKWEVVSNHSNTVLAEIKWHGAWHKYVIQYLEGTIMDKGCHREVDNFIDEQMKLRRNKNAR